MRNEWKEEQNISIVEDEDSVLAISPDDDEKTVLASNRAPYQTEEWEYLDDDDSGSAETDQMICVFEDLESEKSKMCCKFNGTRLKRTFTLRVLRKDIKIFPKFESPGLGEYLIWKCAWMSKIRQIRFWEKLPVNVFWQSLPKSPTDVSVWTKH